MLCRASWTVVVMPFLLLASLVFEVSSQAWAAEPPANPTLVVGNDAGKTITLSPTEFAKLTRSTLQVKEPHSNAMSTYEGVLLYELLGNAGVQFQDPEGLAKGKRGCPLP